VADLLHFGRAATALCISRPELSRTVVSLEAQLGTALFVRPSDRTELTPAGHELRAHVRTLWADEALTAPPADVGQPAPAAAPLRVAIVPGVIVSKWTRTWTERHPGLPIEVVPTPERAQVAVLHDDDADLAFVRLPVDPAGLSVIPLYSEVAVVVLPVDHELTLLDEVSTADLADEPRVAEPDAAAAITLVAAGLGVVVVPQSVARHHHRKDLTYRPVVDVEPTRIALAWRTDRTNDAIEDLVGIVRGRSARSSRAPAAVPARVRTAATEAPRAGTRRRGTGRRGSRG
jgi:DNA-binding transcriptional LysR family regulator